MFSSTYSDSLNAVFNKILKYLDLHKLNPIYYTAIILSPDYRWLWFENI